MRIKLTLQPVENKCRIPINYQHPLSSIIYKILTDASPEYAKWLHRKGYITPSGKTMKFFTFSYLQIPVNKRKQEGSTLVIYNRPHCILYLSTPMQDDFATSFIHGLFMNRKITIGNHYTKEVFSLEAAETVDELHFPPQESVCYKFKCLSPILVSISRGKGQPSTYVVPGGKEEDKLSGLIEQNLYNKFDTICPQEDKDKLLQKNRNISIRFAIDQEYIRQKNHRQITKLITIHEGKDNETKVRGFSAPFYLIGSPFLIHCAHMCGIGEKTSMGFGMIDFLEEVKLEGKIF